jgi:ABC-type amino acid transport/signal transduction systems, periplasmic component/domain
MSGRWSVYGVLLGYWLSCLPVYATSPTDTLETEASKLSLQIGIPLSRHPYAYLDAQKQPAGFLVVAIQQVCQQMQASCQFTGGKTEQLLQDLQTIKVNAVLIVDDFLIPEVDKVKLTAPLCTPNPMFIQKAGEPLRHKPEDFRGSTLSTQEGSIFQIYLLDEYSAQARIKPYPFMENAIFDLVVGRLDALFADETFIQTQITQTALNGYVEFILTPVDTAGILPTAMTLAIREQDHDLFKALETALPSIKAGQPCTDLLSTANTKPAKE